MSLLAPLLPTARRLAIPMIAALSMVQVATVAHAAGIAQAGPSRSRLVTCGGETCLRIVGRRGDPSDVISISGVEARVSGGRDWRVDVPLAEARGWALPSTAAVTVTSAGADGARYRVEQVALPPGALGRHVELVSMIVGGH